MKHIFTDLKKQEITILDGAAFASLEEPLKETVKKIRKKAARYIQQMYHCGRCRIKMQNVKSLKGVLFKKSFGRSLNWKK